MADNGLNILIISDYPFDPERIVGGIAAVTQTLVAALAAIEAVGQVTVVCFHDGEVPSGRVDVQDKVQVYFLRGQRRLNALTRSFWEVRAARRVKAITGATVIHGQEIGWHGDIATRLSRHAVVPVHRLVHRETRMFGMKRFRDRFRAPVIEAMVTRVWRQAAIVISISKYDAATLKHLIRGQHVIIPNPISPIFFAQPPSQNVSKGILFAGVIRRRKNIL